MSITGKNRQPARDKWGQPPAKRGILRGIVRNKREVNGEDAFGQTKIILFDVFTAEDEPLVPVILQGNNIVGQLMDDVLVDVPDPTPSVRPIRTKRLNIPYWHEGDVIAFDPTDYHARHGIDRRWTIVIFASLLLIVIVLIFYFSYYFGYMG